MATRSILAEQLKEYQIPFRSDWPTASSNSSSRVDVIFAIWEVLMFACLVFTGVSLYFRYMRLAFLLICVTIIILVCMRITNKVRQNRKSTRRMLLPLSM
ncbi:hypothetical protein MUK42_10918 [Musa troglodytarum]|uniref:Uncharacterized protein n=2 Tax=Musa troglodytarum TaxID=320322 RepID=A0A9E7GG93_9LILI|nr:hypothetical protein MUK42_10918 [Musa troglodytarum]